MHCDRARLDDANEVLRAGPDEPPPKGIYTLFEAAVTGGRGPGMFAVLGVVRGHKGAGFKVLFPANESPGNGAVVKEKGRDERKVGREGGSVRIADNRGDARRVWREYACHSATPDNTATPVTRFVQFRNPQAAGSKPSLSD